MIEIKTAPADIMGFGRVFEIAPGVYRNADTGEIIISDGEQALVVKVSDNE